MTNTAQFLAADPKASAWVAASAGTGKTKVLTDRLLNLMLQGFMPERILCLTFTKAAAAEMANRLTHRLAQWATLSEEALIQELSTLIGAIPHPTILSRARQLFPLVLDAPGGMKIQTIHGFCQSILGRFPLEAGIPPHFRVLDDVQAEDLLIEAQHAAFTNPSPEIQAALSILNPIMADNRFTSILGDFYASRTRIQSILAPHTDYWAYALHLLTYLGLDPSWIESPQELWDAKLLDSLKRNHTPEDAASFEDYAKGYLTLKGEIRKKLKGEDLRIADRVHHLFHAFSTLQIVQRTVAFIRLFQEIMGIYQDCKTRRCGLDYDDLIQHTQMLLAQPGLASWVLYKLDGGIDHLLVDEAQDTNAAQWQIILSLTTEFFTPDKPYRTIFAVGDAKQSIYSFQGANPEEFLRLKTHFATLANGIGQDWRDVSLDLSYRSTAAVLAIVDQVFAHEKTRRGVSFQDIDIVHKAFREHQPGLVALWPLAVSTNNEDRDALPEGEWQLPIKRRPRENPQSVFADYLASQVEAWIESKEILPSTGQPIQPRDILILVKKRTSLVQDMVRALKKRGVPTAGADRLVLTDHIAVMDLMALGQFVLLPEDDLSLACILRSPLIGLSEDDLFTLAHGRKGTLWASLSEKSLEFPAAYQWLKACLRQADLVPVYEFYSWVLTEQDGWRLFLSRLGTEAEEALEEFLNQALIYDQDQASTLQGFIQFLSRQSLEIKRDSSQTVHNQVRIMTIHGSKGLQAPIVILPDATQSSKGKADPLLWGESVVMLRPTQTHDTEGTGDLKDESAQAMAEENRRLLYVALTRAQDHLFVGGWLGAKDLAEDCWYRLIQGAIETKGGMGATAHVQGKSVPLALPDQAVPLKPGLDLPVWATESPKDAMMSKEDKPAPAKEEAAPMGDTERGILMHRFFEVLPDLPEACRYEAAIRLVRREKLPLDAWEKDIQASLKILKDFPELFGPDSLAEVPLVGEVDGAPFQGRLDRLLVGSDTLTIIDYKTNRFVPQTLDQVPAAYVAQLEGYAKALQSLYPEHKIRKLLLWTTGPTVQEI